MMASAERNFAPAGWIMIVAVLLVTGLSAQVASGQSPPDATSDIVEEARLHLTENEPTQAVELLSEADALDKDGYFVLGRAYQQVSMHDQAIEAFIRADSTDARHLMAWAESLTQMGLFRDAEQRYAEAFTHDNSYRAGFELGRLLMRREAWPQAQRVLEQVRDLEPEHPEVLHQLGLAYFEGQRLAPAIHHLHRARKLSPDNVRIALRLTAAQMEADSLGAALRISTEALDEQPESPELWVRKGKLANYLIGPQAGGEAFRQALALGDSTSSTLERAGVAHYEAGEFEQAYDALTEAFARDDENENAAFYLGLARKELGDLEGARETMKEAAELAGQPLIASIYEQLADVYLLQSSYNEAIIADRLVLRLDPGRISAKFHLATVYDAYYEDPEPALETYRAFLEQVDEEAFPEMQEYARHRIQQLAGEQFFGN